jgi:selenoprotein W-related protein
LTADLLKGYEPEIAAITLVPSDGGRFEVTVDEKLVYSKLQTGRHAEPGEVMKLVKKSL